MNQSEKSPILITARSTDEVIIGGARAVQSIKRPDGSEVRITAQECFGFALTRSIDVFVHRRDTPEMPWSLASDRPHPNWRQMPVEEYIRYGRSEKFRTVSHGEIFSVVAALNQACEACI